MAAMGPESSASRAEQSDTPMGTRPGTGPGPRQVGGIGGTVGALKRGSTRDHLSEPGTKGHSSIPSKYETLINVNAKAQDGFGSRTYRLEGHDVDTPGAWLLAAPRLTREAAREQPANRADTHQKEFPKTNPNTTAGLMPKERVPPST